MDEYRVEFKGIQRLFKAPSFVIDGFHQHDAGDMSGHSVTSLHNFPPRQV